jgi:hypothetical protein
MGENNLRFCSATEDWGTVDMDFRSREKTGFPLQFNIAGIPEERFAEREAIFGVSLHDCM